MIIGSSPDPVEVMAKFKEKQGLPFVLATDQSHAIELTRTLLEAADEQHAAMEPEHFIRVNESGCDAVPLDAIGAFGVGFGGGFRG